MCATCSNPDCGVPFDYREGRLVRFCKPLLDGRSLVDESRVEHFWLCGTCSELYIFKYERWVGMTIRPRVRPVRERPALSFVATAS